MNQQHISRLILAVIFISTLIPIITIHGSFQCTSVKLGLPDHMHNLSFATLRRTAILEEVLRRSDSFYVNTIPRPSGLPNPPSQMSKMNDMDSAISALELQFRLIIGIACAVSSGGADPDITPLASLPIISNTLESFLKTVNTGYIYRFYLAHDYNDKIFANISWQHAIQNYFTGAVAASNAALWHPADSVEGRIDPSTLIVDVIWVLCNYTGKPAWAQNDAAMAAFNGGADYVFRTNDDTSLPSRKDWISIFIQDLRSRQPLPNLGVVGPTCTNPDVLTHDFTHKTHVNIHGFYYPRSLPTWWADDWMTRVYDGFRVNAPLMVKRKDVTVKHHLAKQRYSVNAPSNLSAILDFEIKKGKTAILQYVKEKTGVNIV